MNKKEISIVIDAKPFQFAARHNKITGDFNYNVYNPKTKELYTELVETRIICGYFNCVKVDSFLFWIMFSAFWTQKELDKVIEDVSLLVNS